MTDTQASLLPLRAILSAKECNSYYWMQRTPKLFTLASRWGSVTMKCSVSLALSSETCFTSFVVGLRLVGPRPTGYSPVAACLTLQTIISIRLVSCRSSNANHQSTHLVNYQWRKPHKYTITAHHSQINHHKYLQTINLHDAQMCYYC